MSIKLSLIELGAVGYGETRSDAIKNVSVTIMANQLKCLELLADVFELKN